MVANSEIKSKEPRNSIGQTIEENIAIWNAESLKKRGKPLPPSELAYLEGSICYDLNDDGSPSWYRMSWAEYWGWRRLSEY